MARPADPRARSALLKSARAVFSRHGFEEAGVEAITRGAGLSKGAFYLHFRSKEDCFLELVHQLLAYVESVMGEHALRSAQGWSRSQEQETSDAEIREARVREARARNLSVLHAMWQWRDVVGVLLRGPGTRFAYLADELVQRLLLTELRSAQAQQALGLIRQDLDVDVVMQFAAGGFVALGRRMADLEGPPDLDRWADTLTGLMSRGLSDPHPLPAASLAQMRAADALPSPAHRPPHGTPDLEPDK
jgi:AcrR family transcriptional regulator